VRRGTPGEPPRSRQRRGRAAPRPERRRLAELDRAVARGSRAWKVVWQTRQVTPRSACGARSEEGLAAVEEPGEERSGSWQPAHRRLTSRPRLPLQRPERVQVEGVGEGREAVGAAVPLRDDVGVARGARVGGGDSPRARAAPAPPPAQREEGRTSALSAGATGRRRAAPRPATTAASRSSSANHLAQRQHVARRAVAGAPRGRAPSRSRPLRGRSRRRGAPARPPRRAAA